MPFNITKVVGETLVKATLADPVTTDEANVVSRGASKALLVVSHPSTAYSTISAWLSNPTYSTQMARTLGFTGTPEVIYAENVEWVGTAVDGTWVLNSTTGPQAGTYCIDGYETRHGDTLRLAHGTTDFDLSTMTALSGFIYIDNWSVAGTKEIGISWVDSADDLVGTRLSLADYIDTTTFGEWLPISIPLEDFAVTSVVRSLWVDIIKLGAGDAIDFRLDEIALQEAGGPITYSMYPPVDTSVRLTQLKCTMVDNWVGAANSGDMPNLSYDKFLGMDRLTKGILIKLYSGGQLVAVESVRDVRDMLSRAGATFGPAIQDTENTMVSVLWNFQDGVLMNYTDGDRVEVVIQDNMSELLDLKVHGTMRIESSTS